MRTEVAIVGLAFIPVAFLYAVLLAVLEVILPSTVKWLPLTLSMFSYPVFLYAMLAGYDKWKERERQSDMERWK